MKAIANPFAPETHKTGLRIIRSPVSFRLMPSALQLLNGSFGGILLRPQTARRFGNPISFYLSG